MVIMMKDKFILETAFDRFTDVLWQLEIISWDEHGELQWWSVALRKLDE